MATTASAGEKYPLAEQQVISVVEEFQEGVGQLENIVGKIALYVDSPATQGILFAPVRVGMRGAFHVASAAGERGASEGDSGVLEAEQLPALSGAAERDRGGDQRGGRDQV